MKFRQKLTIIKPCPHCHRKRRLSQISATIVASVDRLLLPSKRSSVRYKWTCTT